MRKLAIAALIAAGTLTTTATANAADPILGPCATVSELFETANIQMEPTHPAVGAAYQTVCRVTG